MHASGGEKLKTAKKLLGFAVVDAMGGSKTRLYGGVGATERMLPKRRPCLAGKLWIRIIERKTGEIEYKYSIGGFMYFNHNPFVKHILFF